MDSSINYSLSLSSANVGPRHCCPNSSAIRSLDFSHVNKIDAPKPDDMTSVELSLSASCQIGKDFSKFFDTTQPGSMVDLMAGSGSIPIKSVDTMCY